MIRFACPSCGKVCNAKDEAAGTRGKCPGCGQVMQIPTFDRQQDLNPPAKVPSPATPSLQPVPTAAWFYMKPGFLQEETTGPIPDATLLQLAFDGQIKPKVLVTHPVHTQGKWVTMEQIPAALAKYDEGIQYRQQLRDEEARA